jgi:outer membrane biosynthesis protein TonB
LGKPKIEHEISWIFEPNRRSRSCEVSCGIIATVCLSIVTYGQSSPQKSPAAAETTYLLEPISISNIQYPASAREQKIQGQVRATMLISEKGTVEHVQVFKADQF